MGYVSSLVFLISNFKLINYSNRFSTPQINTTLNGNVVDNNFLKMEWVEVRKHGVNQVSLVLIQEKVRVSFRHKSRAFVISAPSHTLGKQLIGLCGEEYDYLWVSKKKL